MHTVSGIPARTMLRPPRKRNAVESPSVAFPCKSAKDSPSTDYRRGLRPPWRPGEPSANPAGRPRTSDLKAEVRTFADEADPKIRKTRLRVWLEICDRRARQGSPKHLEMLLAYGWGRPTTPLEHGGSLNLGEVIQQARQRAQEAQAALPETTPRNGHATPQEATAAALLPEQGSAREDGEQPTEPPAKKVKGGFVDELADALDSISREPLQGFSFQVFTGSNSLSVTNE